MFRKASAADGQLTQQHSCPVSEVPSRCAYKSHCLRPSLLLSFSATHSPGRALISSHGAHQVPFPRGTVSVVISSRDERLRLLNRATDSNCRRNRVLKVNTIACRLAPTESEKVVAANRTELNQCRSSEHSRPIQRCRGKCKSYWGTVLVFSPERPALMMAINHAHWRCDFWSSRQLA